MHSAFPQVAPDIIIVSLCIDWFRKISHKDPPKVVTNIIKNLNDKFRVESLLTETRGKVHDYVGMTLDYSTPGKVMLSMMFEYLEDMLQRLPETLVVRGHDNESAIIKHQENQTHQHQILLCH